MSVYFGLLLTGLCKWLCPHLIVEKKPKFIFRIFSWRNLSLGGYAHKFEVAMEEVAEEISTSSIRLSFNVDFFRVPPVNEWVCSFSSCFFGAVKKDKKNFRRKTIMSQLLRLFRRILPTLFDFLCTLQRESRDPSLPLTSTPRNGALSCWTSFFRFQFFSRRIVQGQKHSLTYSMHHWV